VKNVVIVSADFLPSSLPAAQRVRIFAGYLHRYGWNPIVLTVQEKYLEWDTDSNNELLIPSNVEIIRTRALTASQTRMLGFGDLGFRTLWFHCQEISRLAQERKIDLIMITVPSYLSMLLGRMAHEKYQIPYIIDYQDPWVTEYYWKLPVEKRPPKWPLVHGMAQTLEPFALKSVSCLTGVSKETTSSIVDRYHWLKEENCFQIPLGIDPSDFELIRSNPRLNPIFKRGDGFLHVSYVGACMPAMYSVIKTILCAVREGTRKNPSLFERFRLHFVGSNYRHSDNDQILPLARECGVSHLVSEHRSRVSYLDSLQIQLDSDLLLLPGSEETHYTASKLYAYLLTGKPILGLFHKQSQVSQVARELDLKSILTFSEVADLGGKVPDLIAGFELLVGKSSKATSKVAESKLEAYTANGISKKFAEAFHRAANMETK
jgi:hypothetical protein